MTVKEYLYKALDAKKRIDIKQQVLEELRTKAERITIEIKERVQSQCANDILASVVAEIVDTEKEWAKQIKEYQEILKRYTAEIEQLEDTRYVAVLKHKYIDAMNWPDIAKEMNYSVSHALKIHEHALQAFNKKIKVDSK